MIEAKQEAKAMIEFYGYAGALERARNWAQLPYKKKSAEWWGKVADEIERVEDE